ncbi:unnamed protein product [Rotaria sp. Silwood1]|nr:unnamed protein product [Rotaria sp. Silwood1]CAF3801867.1 unnamed protein product [Rotaria sp. Silwood1]CAF3821464.1 unnamed protein product [Rotaria sp. Silwood1]CAF4822459.1 unnamed protein product [Rotaria sp. Silwood1]
MTIETPEYEHFTIGCDRSPLNGRGYCAEHVHIHHSQQTNLIQEDDDDNYILLRNGKRRMSYHKLSCNTKKSKPESYISNCHRTFGIIIYVFNCNVILAAHEIIRSETVKEILAGLCDIIRISSTNIIQPHTIADSWLPRTIVYDDCCHVCTQLSDTLNSNIKQGSDTDLETPQSICTTPDIALIHNDIELTGQQLTTNHNNILTTELVLSYMNDHFDGFPLPPFTEFQKKKAPQEQNQDLSIEVPHVQTTTEVQTTNTQPPISISSSELTPKQLLQLNQTHISSTYDLRTNQQSENPHENLQLHRLSIPETDDQQIDLFSGGEIPAQHAILLQQPHNDSNENTSILDQLQSKSYKDYVLDNSKNMESRRPTPHIFQS